MKRRVLLMLFCLVLFMPAKGAGGENTSPCCEEEDSEVDNSRISVMLKHGKDLALTDDQKSKLKTIRASLRSDNAWNIAELTLKRPVLKNMKTVPAPDPSVLKETMKKVSDAELRMNLLKVDAFSKAYALLTDEQKARFGKIWVSLHKTPSKQK